jgi:hypothetical protein
MVTQGHRQHARAIEAWVAGIAAVAGLGVALAGPSPTGSTAVDVLLLIVVVSACIFVIATAPWLSLWRGTRRPMIAAGVLGVLVQVLARLGNLWFFGFSSAVSIVPLLILTLVAVQGASGRRRIVMWSLLGGLVAAAALALIGFGVAAEAARPNLTRGTDEAKRALRSLKAGDFAGARNGFQLAAGLLSGAGDDLGAAWAQPARLLPVVAQHRRLAEQLADSASAVSGTIASVLGDIDFDQLRVLNGSIDVDAITALQDPLARLNTALADLHSAVDSVNSPWLVQPVQKRLATLTGQIDDQQAEGNRAAIAVQRVPAMLGANGKRVYFIAFTTPTEARGSGGFMGNWAEVTFDEGHISVTGFGRTADLIVNGDTEHWVRITSSPNFPDVAKLIADGYPAYSGHPVDGVFSMDVYTIAGLMTLTGPVDLTTIPQTVTPDNAAKFLLSDQYAVAQDRAERIDLLDEVAQTTIARLLSSSLPAPPDLIKLLSPFAAQGRLDGWSSHADEEDLIERMGMSGELPALQGGDGLALAMDNIGNNKIDYYLTSSAKYAVTTDPANGTATSSFEITLRNSAPVGVADPAFVFGNNTGDPPGTNVMRLSVLSAMPVAGISVGGQQRPADQTASSGDFVVTSVNVTIPAGAAVTVSLQLGGALDLTHGYRLVLRNYPSVTPPSVAVTVDGVAAKGSPYKLSGVVRIGAKATDG